MNLLSWWHRGNSRCIISEIEVWLHTWFILKHQIMLGRPNDDFTISLQIEKNRRDEIFHIITALRMRCSKNVKKHSGFLKQSWLLMYHVWMSIVKINWSKDISMKRDYSCGKWLWILRIIDNNFREMYALQARNMPIKERFGVFIAARSWILQTNTKA